MQPTTVHMQQHTFGEQLAVPLIPTAALSLGHAGAAMQLHRNTAFVRDAKTSCGLTLPASRSAIWIRG